MGVEYCVRTYVAEQEDQKSHKRSSVTLAIKKVNTRRPNENLIIFYDSELIFVNFYSCNTHQHPVDVVSLALS